MIEIGQTQKLLALRKTPPGVFLGRGEAEVLLPNKYVPQSLLIGEEVEVFVYTDSEDRPVATTLQPKAEVGQFACLQVVGLSSHGAFLDWGLEKDLFVPNAEQATRMAVGQQHVVAVCLDERTQRVMASSKLGQFISPPPEETKPGDEVDLHVFRISPLGPQVLVNELFEGLLYSNQTFADVPVGARLRGYIHRVRPDGKVDVGLRPFGAAGRNSECELILKKLESNNGVLPLDDHSAPEEVAKLLGISKKAFKRAIGSLYRDKKVTLHPGRVELIRPGKKR